MPSVRMRARHDEWPPSTVHRTDVIHVLTVHLNESIDDAIDLLDRAERDRDERARPELAGPGGIELSGAGADVSGATHDPRQGW